MKIISLKLERIARIIIIIIRKKAMFQLKDGVIITKKFFLKNREIGGGAIRLDLKYGKKCIIKSIHTGYGLAEQSRIIREVVLGFLYQEKN